MEGSLVISGKVLSRRRSKNGKGLLYGVLAGDVVLSVYSEEIFDLESIIAVPVLGVSSEGSTSVLYLQKKTE